MTANIQIHHVLPNAIYDRFKVDIARWTESQIFIQNAGYNLIALPKDTSGTMVQADLVGHSGSHPGLNDAWTAVLNDIKDQETTGDIILSSGLSWSRITIMPPVTDRTPLKIRRLYI
ncbi:MAG: AHH domain-containing protein [Pseudomonadota bacterium]